MDEIIRKANELSELIKKEPLVIEFFRLKEIFEQNEELEAARKNLARLSSNKSDSRYIELKEMYDNHPLVKNYYALKSEVDELLNEIKNIIL